MEQLSTAIVILAGPIKYWWDENWGTPEHNNYVAWRQALNDALVDAGYLVYRPHEAFKGQWDERAQSVNDRVLRIADVIINLTPPGVPSQGTDAELHYAANFGTPILPAPPTENIEVGVAFVMKRIEALGLMRPIVRQSEVVATLVMTPSTSWILPAFLEHHLGSVLRAHYYDDEHRMQAVDVMAVEVGGGGTGHALVVSPTQLFKIEVLEPVRPDKTKDFDELVLTIQ